MLVFEERGKPENPEKNLSEQSANLRHRVQIFLQISGIPDLIRKFGVNTRGLYASV